MTHKSSFLPGCPWLSAIFVFYFFFITNLSIIRKPGMCMGDECGLIRFLSSIEIMSSHLHLKSLNMHPKLSVLQRTAIKLLAEGFRVCCIPFLVWRKENVGLLWLDPGTMGHLLPSPFGEEGEGCTWSFVDVLLVILMLEAIHWGSVLYRGQEFLQGK